MNRCPFCGRFFCYVEPSGMFVICGECGAVGPCRQTEQAAIEAWNQRWVPSIVWTNPTSLGPGQLAHAYAGGVEAGLCWRVNAIRWGWRSGRRGSDNCTNEEEARAQLEEAWREAYLEMQRTEPAGSEK